MAICNCSSRKAESEMVKSVKMYITESNNNKNNEKKRINVRRREGRKEQ